MFPEYHVMTNSQNFLLQSKISDRKFAQLNFALKREHCFGLFIHDCKLLLCFFFLWLSNELQQKLKKSYIYKNN